jgi:hypothetical protein
MDDTETAEAEARAYAAWLAAHGYDEASVWTFGCALDNYGPPRYRRYASGYAVRYTGTLVRDDGSRAEHPTAGIVVFCQDTQLAAGNLIQADRALVTFGTGDGQEGTIYTPCYVASYNERDTALRRDQSVNPGTLPYVILHELTPMIGMGGPKRFYELRLTPAGDLATGTRVRVVSGDHAGQRGVVRHPHPVLPLVELDPAYDPEAQVTREWGQLRQIGREHLEPGDRCPDGHELWWAEEGYETPRWVHGRTSDLMTCPSAYQAWEAAHPAEYPDN